MPVKSHKDRLKLMPRSLSDAELLAAKARQIRCDIIQMIAQAGSGHPGGSLSAADIVAYLYFHQLRIDPANPQWEDRDRFVLSKGHACPALYAALAERGYFPKDVLWSLRDQASILQGHPDMLKTPGVDMTTGSLGQGFSCAVGMALGGKLARKDFRVWALLSDGEMQAGIVWEAAMAAAHYHLDRLIAIVDYNKLQVDGPVASVMNIEPLSEKWRAFGWDVSEIDGHSFPEIDAAFEKCMALEGKPHVVVAHTIKGRGVSVMEGNLAWHAGAPEKDKVPQYLAEIAGEKPNGS
jgi:transketolase